MSDVLEAINNLTDINFIEDISLEGLQNLLITAYQNKYEEITGKRVRLQKADPNRIILLATAQVIYQGFENLDKAGKMNFLKYSYGGFLRQLGAFKGVAEIAPKKALVNVKWSLETARSAATGIKKGSRVTADFETYFETTEYNEIPAGETQIILTMTCTETGTKGNGFAPGEINQMVDPMPFIAAVVNVDTSEGGTDKESDDSLRERIYLSPSRYSVAGPDDAYIYHAKSYDANIGDVLPTNPSPGVVRICFIMKDGSLPGTAEIAGLQEHLQQRGKRPLTDKVVCTAPDIVNYTIAGTYYINESDRDKAVSIQEKAAAAIEEYKTWQCSKIGRDINPDELRKALVNAGVKRVEIASPAFTILGESEVARCTKTALAYGGLEDD